MVMNDDAQLYHENNRITKHHARMFLEEYANEFIWKDINARVIDIGSADGSVTEILKEYIPPNYEILLGCDISDNMVKFANKHYGNEKSKFIELDIESNLPTELKENFDRVFSFYVFHWIKNQEKGFKNVYELLTDGGKCFMTLVAYTPIYDIYRALSKTEKWGQYMTNINSVISPYNGIQDPEKKVNEILKNIGFRHIDVRCKQAVYVFENAEEFKSNIAAISPCKFPEEEMNIDFLEDCINIARDINLFNEDANTYTFNNNLIVVLCTK